MILSFTIKECDTQRNDTEHYDNEPMFTILG
jgi:hypothetical protein